MKITQDGIVRKQVELLYAQGIVAIVSGAGVLLLTGVYYWQVIDNLTPLLWMLVLAVLSAARILLFQSFRKVDLRSFPAGKWLRRHMLLTFLSGVVWGLLGLYYDPAWPSTHQVMLFMVIAGVAAGSISAHAAVMEVYVLFLIPLLLPLEVKLLIHHDSTSSYLSGLVMLYAMGLMALARRHNLQTVDTIHLSLAQQFLQEEVSSGTRLLKQAQRALRTSEHRFGQILESSLDGFWEWDVPQDQVYLSPRWKEQLGFLDHELPNEFDSWKSRLHPDERDEVLQKIQAYLMKPWGNWEEEFRLRHKSGSYRWILARATPTFGVDDTLVKLTGVHVDITQRVQAESRAKHLAYHDGLTELPNRLLFNDRVDHAISRSKPIDQWLGILFLDLDRFKHVNDSLGHPAGDRVLVKIAARLISVVREGDTLARLGGDEFALLVENVPHTQQLAVVANKLLACFEKPFEEEGHEFYLNASIGITVYPRDGSSAAELLKNADAAMYKAKNSGRGGFQFYTEQLTSNAYQHFTLESGLRQALQKSQFVLHYQPKIDLSNGRLIGVEALVRWLHPVDGLIPPDAFISVAEESGLIREIGEWVLLQACSDAQQWKSRNLDFGHVAVNLSGVQIQHEEFVAATKRILQTTGMDAASLELEITENFLMRDVNASARYLQDLRQLGVSIAIDDFGTGYSSLAHLTRFPIDKLKIDRSFVSKVCQSKQDDEISRIIVGLAHTLGMRVVAEGIEHIQQLRFLRDEGCDEGQGFYISQPLPNEDFMAFVENRGGESVASDLVDEC